MPIPRVRTYLGAASHEFTSLVLDEFFKPENASRDRGCVSPLLLPRRSAAWQDMCSGSPDMLVNGKYSPDIRAKMMPDFSAVLFMIAANIVIGAKFLRDLVN
jgi:hypothetical protein